MKPTITQAPIMTCAWQKGVRTLRQIGARPPRGDPVLGHAGNGSVRITQSQAKADLVYWQVGKKKNRKQDSVSMRLWTIQTEDAYRAFERRGFLRGDKRRADQGWLTAYEWMADQMVLRIGRPPAGCTAPVWAWRIWHERTARPDLRTGAHLPRGTAGVRIAFEAAPNQVLLSDFTRWHVVLNNGWLADSEREDEAWERNPPEDVRKTWERIFDLERGCPEYFGPVSSRGVQAALWQIEWSQVTEVTRFVAR